MAGVSSSECDLCIVYNADANAWNDYIVRVVTRFVANQGAPPLSVSSVEDSSLTRTGRCALPPSAIVMVILSPAHLDFLRSHVGGGGGSGGVNYRTLVDTRRADALVLRCGVACFADIAHQDSGVFAQFFGWTLLDEIANGEAINKAVDRLLTKRSAPQDDQVYVVPDKILSRPSSSTSAVRRQASGTSDSPSNCSNNRSNGGWTTTTTPGDNGVRTSDDASTSPHFRVIPTTIRCEARYKKNIKNSDQKFYNTQSAIVVLFLLFVDQSNLAMRQCGGL